MRPSAIVLAAATLLLPIHEEAPRSDDVPFTVTRLELDLAPDYATGTLGGSATLALRNTSDRPATRVPIILNRLMSVTRVTTEAGRPLRFTQQIVRFEDDARLQVNAIQVVQPRPVEPGDSVAIVVHYAGVLVGYTETGSLYIRDQVARDFTILRADAFAFPVSGVPSWQANRAAPEEPFAFRARVTVPRDLVVAMGGVAEPRETRDSLVTWTYRGESVPFLNITIAPYRVLEQGAAHIFYFAGDSAGAARLSRAIAGAMERYQLWFGPLARSARLTVMEIPEGWGSQGSLAAGIIQTADAFRDPTQLPQLYHELAHLWNAADRERPSSRWNEGLAGFLQWRMAAVLDGWDQWPTRVDRAVQNARHNCPPRSPCDSIPLIRYGEARLTDRSYPVGFLLFYSLYQVMGEEGFDRAYARFFQAHQGGAASTGDLIAAFETTDPRTRSIFRDWLLTTHWSARLAAGESVESMVAGYRAVR